MNEVINLFKSKSALTNLFVVLLLLIGLPIGLGLVRQQQNLRSQAGSEPIIFVAGECVKNRADGSQYTICPTVDLELTSPLGPGADDGSSDSSPSASINPSPSSLPTISPTASPTARPTALPTPSGLVGHWKLNENSGTTANDSSENNNKGTLTKGPTWTSGKYGSAIKFDGNDDYVTMGNHTKFEMAKGNLTLSMWFKSTSQTTGRTMGGEGAVDTGGKRFILELNDSNECGSVGTVKFEIDDNTTKKSACSTGKNYNDGNWHHAVGVREGNSIKLYMDGTLQKTTDITAGYGSLTTDRPFVIGAAVKNSDQSIVQHFPGSLDDVRLYNKALTQSEITNIMNNGTAPTPSPSPSTSPSPTDEPIPTPTPEPGDVEIITTHYKIAESPRELQAAPWLAYPINPLFTNYILKSVDPGKKTLHVQFKDSENTLSGIETKEIELVGSPPNISTINCSRSLTGTGLSIKISGLQFGAIKGKVDLTDDKGNAGALNITSWTDEEVNGNVEVGTGDAEGNTINFVVIRPDQTSASGVCTVGGLSDLALGAKLFCRTLSDTDTDGVEVVIAENKTGGKVVKLKDLSIDSKGILQGVDNQFENGQEYIVSIKAPSSLRRVSKPFTAGDGTTQLVFRENDLNDGNQNVLPIGDIAPLGNTDGKIDNRDKFELIREFGLTSDEDGGGGVIRAADFNQDKAVNSIDWACMRYDFPSPGESAVDEPEPKAGNL